jgi:hypothetical protein
MFSQIRPAPRAIGPNAAGCVWALIARLVGEPGEQMPDSATAIATGVSHPGASNSAPGS